MGSKKRAAWSKQKAEFNASLSGLDSLFPDDGHHARSSSIDDAFTAEDKRRGRAAEEREERRRARACESKNRYASRQEAEDAVRSCAEWGTTGLHVYRCPYCNGWHLTSHPHS